MASRWFASERARSLWLPSSDGTVCSRCPSSWCDIRRWGTSPCTRRSSPSCATTRSDVGPHRPLLRSRAASKPADILCAGLCTERGRTDRPCVQGGRRRDGLLHAACRGAHSRSARSISMAVPPEWARSRAGGCSAGGSSPNLTGFLLMPGRPCRGSNGLAVRASWSRAAGCAAASTLVFFGHESAALVVGLMVVVFAVLRGGSARSVIIRLAPAFAVGLLAAIQSGCEP